MYEKFRWYCLTRKFCRKLLLYISRQYLSCLALNAYVSRERLWTAHNTANQTSRKFSNWFFIFSADASFLPPARRFPSYQGSESRGFWEFSIKLKSSGIFFWNFQEIHWIFVNFWGLIQEHKNAFSGHLTLQAITRLCFYSPNRSLPSAHDGNVGDNPKL